jgi:formate-dependent phosphoribosylglycinamide formyltransferase (GAR transformylase)
MPNVVFVAPFLLAATSRFVRSVAQLPGVRFGLISQGPVEQLDADLRPQVAAHYRVDDTFDAQQLIRATKWIASRMQGVDRLLGTLEQLQVPLAEAREELGLEGMRAETARNFREKNRMKELLRAAGIPVARQRLLRSVEEGVAFARDVGYPLVVKPPAGAGAIATFQVEDEEQMRRGLQGIGASGENPVQCEEFISGLERSFEVVSMGGKPVWHSLTRYAPPPLDVLRNPWIQWTVLLPGREVDDPGYDDVRKAGFAALKALGMDTGISHMEWFRRRDNSVLVSEIAGRPPGAQIMTLISYAHDIDMYSAWARLMVYGEFDPPPRKYAAGAAFLRGQGRGRVTAIHGIERAQRELGQLVVEAKLPQKGQPQASSYEGEGYVIFKHEDTTLVERALQRVIEIVRVELG